MVGQKIPQDLRRVILIAVHRRDRAQRPNSDRTEYGLSAATRSRKIATLRSFFNYLTNKAHLLEDNPVKELDSPKLKKHGVLIAARDGPPHRQVAV